MRVRSRHLAIATVLLVSLGTQRARADWKPGGTLISFSPDVVVEADGHGGIFASNNPATVFPVCYHLDAGGNVPSPWSVGGIELTPGMTVSEHAAIRTLSILADDEGGAFFLTREKSPYQGSGGFWYPDQYYLHRRDMNGVVASGWTRTGVCLETPYLDPRYVGLHPPCMVSDERGGVIIAWLGQGVIAEHPTLVVQRVTPDGSRAWGDDGIIVAEEAEGACTLPALVPDGSGGALAFWGHWDSAGALIRIRGQHVARSGERLWGLEGRDVSSEAYDRVASAVPADGGWVWASYHPAISATSDGQAGAILAWAGSRGADLDILAARVTADGVNRWGRDVVVCGAPGEQATVHSLNWHGEGAVVAWRDGRQGADVGIYAQAIGEDGRARWRTDGVAVALGKGERGPVRLGSDGHEGVYLAWGDSEGGGELFGQRLLHSGRPAPGWPESGALVSRSAISNPIGSLELRLFENRNGTAIVAWTSSQSGSLATLLTARGPLGFEAAKGGPDVLDAREVGDGTLLAIRGVSPGPIMVGGQVRLSLLDSSPAALQLFDPAGRMVWSCDLERVAGSRELTLGEPAKLPSGIYLVRVVQGAHMTTARAIALH
jgi:hypothetical protein